MTDRSIVLLRKTKLGASRLSPSRASQTHRESKGERFDGLWTETTAGTEWLLRHTSHQPASQYNTHSALAACRLAHTNGNLMALFKALNKCNLNETQILQKFTRKIFCPCKFIANRMPGRSHKFILRKHHVLLAVDRLSVVVADSEVHAPLNSHFTYIINSNIVAVPNDESLGGETVRQTTIYPSIPGPASGLRLGWMTELNCCCAFVFPRSIREKSDSEDHLLLWCFAACRIKWPV